MAQKFTAVHKCITVDIIKLFHGAQIQVFNRLTRHHHGHYLLFQLQAALLRRQKPCALLVLLQTAEIINDCLIGMITVKTTGNIKINKSTGLQLAEGISYGLHRYTGAAGTAGAVKACTHQTALAKGSQTDNLLAQGLVKARCSVRAALHHLAVKLDSQLSLADTCMNQLRCNNIQHRFVNSTGVFHLLQLISTLAQTQLLQHSIKGAYLFEGKILMQHSFPIQGSFFRFYIHNARCTAIIGGSLTKAVHRTDIAEM